MKKLDIFSIIKIVIHLALAVVLFVMSETLVEYIRWLVGGVMCLYALEVLYELLEAKEKEEKLHIGLEAALLLLFAAIMFALGGNYVTACIVWACWSIYREGSEIFLKVTKSKLLPVGLLNAAESIVVIVFSFMLIAEPGEHHALAHVILLGFELIFAVLFPILDNIKFKKAK